MPTFRARRPYRAAVGEGEIAAARPATYREVFAVGEFRALFGAWLLSLLGDQIAKVALVVLVYDRTSSALLAALTYALPLLPWIVGGPVLATVADRLPRREVMVVADVLRFAIVGLMAVPGMPLGVMLALLLIASLLSPPFEAARSATLPEVLDGDRYVVGNSLSVITAEFTQVGGFAIGGLVVAAVGAHGTLFLNALTFLLSALLLRFGVRYRPAAAAAPGETVEGLRGELRRTLVDTREGLQLVFRTPLLRSVLCLAWVGAAFAVVPEGLATAYAADLGKGEGTVGLLMAAGPAGIVVGALLLGRFTAPDRRLRLMRPLAVVSFVPLILTALDVGVVWTLVLWALAGAAQAYQLPANAAFVAAVPPAARGRAFGVAQTGLQVTQGAAIVAAGFAAQLLPSYAVIAAFGLAGLVSAAAVSRRWPGEEAMRPAVIVLPDARPAPEAAPAAVEAAPAVS